MADIYQFLTKDLYVADGPVTTNPDGSSSVVTRTALGGSETASETIISGEIDGNLSFIGGFIQSKNFVSGTSGWRLSADGTLDAVNATLSGTITGATIQTGTTGGRAVLDSTNDELGFYDGSTKIASIKPDIDGDNKGLDIFGFNPAGTQKVNIQMLVNDVTDHYQMELRVGGSIAGMDLEYLDSDGFATLDFNCRIASDLDPDGAGTRDLGNATRYWDDVNYKTLTDRGCLGWYDEGVELQDGRKVSDIEALKSLRMHPTLKTPAGAPRIDYKSMPKHVYRPADMRGEDGKRRPLPRDEQDRPYRMVNGKKEYAQDGAETTALISIMLGSIKELSEEVEKLKRNAK